MPSLAEPSELPSFGRYEPVFRIAAGGMAEVYAARVVDEAGARFVALKRILPELVEDPRLVEMFLDEARLARRVQSAHVVATHELGRASDGTPYLVMELVVGATIASLHHAATNAGGLLPVPVVVELLAQVAQGLDDAHEARTADGTPLQIVHRDVSPRNVLVGLDGRARLLDFGIAKGELRSTRTALGEVKGTQAYFSPEQAVGAAVDRRSDVYGLGVVAWELLVGRRLFPPQTPLESRRRAPARVDEARPALPPALADVVARALAPDPSQRFARADAMARALRATQGASSPDVARVVATLGASAVQKIQLGLQRASTRDQPEGDAPLTARPRHSTSRLKVYATSFVGREREVALVRDRLAHRERLLTLFGPAGIGKTRLAIEAAQGAKEGFAGGVIFCDLTEARSAEGICYVVGAALGVPSMKGGDVASIVTMLGDALEARPPTLVVLDNVEQAIGFVPATLGEWLTTTVRPSFLVTSRERLRLEAETLVELEPLTTTTLSPGERTPAVRLFLDRALKARPTLVVDDAVEALAARIVARLDGLPLAIELAASRVRTVELDALAMQLHDRFHALSRGPRDAAPRQATLDAAIRWSWDLLEAVEQSVFVSLSTFRGSFDAAAVAAVSDVDPLVAELVLEQLADKSLVRAVGRSPGRFGMLESIREFAARELEQRGAHGEVMERFATHFAALARAWDAPGRLARTSEVEQELDNLESAFRWIASCRAHDEERAADLVRLALATEPVLGVRGPITLARALIEEAVTACGAHVIEADLEARARLALARALFVLGAPDEADAQLAEARLVALTAPTRRAEGWIALTEAEQAWARGSLPECLTAAASAIDAAEADDASGGVQDSVLLARACFRRGAVLLLRGDHAPARASLERARAVASWLRNDQLVARCDVSLADLFHDLGDLDEAKAIARAGTELAARLGDPWVETAGLSALGSLALEDDPREAIRYFTLALRTTMASGNLRAEGLFLTFVGLAQEMAGEREQAHATLEAAVSASWRSANQLGEALAQAFLGRLLARAGAIEEAAQALEAAQATLRALGDRIRLAVAKICAAHVELARADLCALVGEREAALAHRSLARAVADAGRAEIAAGLRSADVRLALRVLEADLAEQHDTVPPPP